MHFIALVFALIIFPMNAYAQAADESQLNYRLERETTVTQTPHFPVVTFKKMDAQTSLQMRIDAIVHGISVDLPPEYDYYGYEIRRYMAEIGGAAAYATPDGVATALENVRKARDVFEYWREDLRAEMSDIETQMELQKASPTLRSAYTYNSGVVSAFQTECLEWIDKNEALLDFLDGRRGLYSFKNQVFTFVNPEDRDYFAALFKDREKALTRLRTHRLFSMMVY